MESKRRNPVSCRELHALAILVTARWLGGRGRVLALVDGEHDQSTHIETTIEIAEPVLEQARQLASRRGTTLRALVEAGLRHVIAQSRQQAPFVLRDASFKGKGVQDGIYPSDWSRLRELAYEGRGA